MILDNNFLNKLGFFNLSPIAEILIIKLLEEKTSKDSNLHSFNYKKLRDSFKLTKKKLNLFLAELESKNIITLKLNLIGNHQGIIFNKSFFDVINDDDINHGNK